MNFDELQELIENGQADFMISASGKIYLQFKEPMEYISFETYIDIRGIFNENE